MTALNRTKEDITSMTDDNRIESVDEIISPKDLIDDYPLNPDIADFIRLSRITIKNIIDFDDPRLLVITGPCSIHNPSEAIEYAEKLRRIKDDNPHLFLVMRTYFEKPRTTIGWKGLINDPDMDDSCDIEKGLEISRKLLLEINMMGIPTAVEFLDTITPQYMADLVSWGAIGARTTESQEHRKLASGLSMPIGFKNGTNGDVQIALDAIKASVSKHTFLSIAKDGKIARITTMGNDSSHMILRGGSSGPNYSESDIRNVKEKLQKEGIQTGIMIDLSHANSLKDHRNQPLVCEDIARQIENGNKSIIGVMIEGNLNAGSQKFSEELLPGVSVTDACVDWNTNSEMIELLNSATAQRNITNGL